MGGNMYDPINYVGIILVNEYYQNYRDIHMKYYLELKG